VAQQGIGGAGVADPGPVSGLAHRTSIPGVSDPSYTTPTNNALAVGREIASDQRFMFGFRSSPPPLPAEVLARVVRLASVDGRMLMILGGLFAALSAFSGDAVGATAGVLATAAAIVELHGVGRLKIGDPEAIRWLIRSQLILLAIIILYTSARIATFDPVQMRALITPELVESFRNAGLEEAEIMPVVENFYRFVYIVVGMVATSYQGGMALYYHRRREPVRIALEGDLIEDEPTS